MNWLAHLLLSEPTDGFRLGNLLPDLVPPGDLESLPDDFQRGAACHRRIDAFTDRHPVVRESIRRLAPEYRRFGGTVVDVFYDHFLILDWEKHASVPLPVFAGSVYAAIRTERMRLPARALPALERMAAEDWLVGYREVSGIRRTLERIGLRFRKPQALGGTVSDLLTHRDALRGDFRRFFPELKAHVAAQIDGRQIPATTR